MPENQTTDIKQMFQATDGRRALTTAHAEAPFITGRVMLSEGMVERLRSMATPEWTPAQFEAARVDMQDWIAFNRQFPGPGVPSLSKVFRLRRRAKQTAYRLARRAKEGISQ